MTSIAYRATALLLPLALLIGAGTVSAFQPTVVGVQPLRERIVAIDAEVQRLNERLRAADVSAEDRVEAYRQYQALTAERERLSQRVAEVSDPARENPLINYASPRAAALTVPPDLREQQRSRALPAELAASQPVRLQVRGITEL